MKTAEIIKQAREALGMTQEDLAERLEVSRQAVSKWELGASLPSSENLKLLEEALGVSFPGPEEPDLHAAPEEAPVVRAPFWNWKRTVLLILGVLILLALLINVMFMTLTRGAHTDVPQLLEPRITGIYFFDQDAAPLQPDLGDGWNSFTAGKRVLVMVEFEDSPKNSVNAVSLFLTPTGTEALEYREQIAVQAAGEGRAFALFAWDIPQEGLMGHLEAVLECGDGFRVTQTRNVTAPPLFQESSELPGILRLSSSEINADASDMGHYMLEAYGVPFAEVEWSSSNPDVARVANTGRVFIEGPGEAVVTASWKGQTAECLVRVGAVGEEGNTDLDNPNLAYMPEGGIFHESEALTIPSGVTLVLGESPFPLPASGAPGEEIIWTSSNPDIAEVSGIGTVFPVSPGGAVITASWNGQTAKCQVHVINEPEPTGVPGVSISRP